MRTLRYEMRSAQKTRQHSAVGPGCTLSSYNILKKLFTYKLIQFGRQTDISGELVISLVITWDIVSKLMVEVGVIEIS